MTRTVVAGYGKQLALHLQHPSESNSEESSLSYGGLGCNNPGRLVLDEARAVFGKRQIGCLVGIDTGQAQIIGVERPGLFQQIVPINDIELEALKGVATDCESTHEDISSHYPDLPYFRLNVEQGMQQIRLSEWERLDNVEANTAQYMR